MPRAPRRTPRAAVVDEGDDGGNTLGTFQVPAILLDEEGPPNFECDEEIVTIGVGKAQEGVGFSWIGDAKPSDIPTPAELLARYGPGHYKLTGKCFNRKIRKQRILSVGDWKPAGVSPATAAQAAAPQLPSGSPAAGMISFLTTIAAVMTPLVVPVLAYMRESSAASRAQVEAANERMLAAMTTFGGARNADMENLLKAAIANLGPQGGTTPAGSNKVWLELLEIQRTMLSKPAKESDSSDFMAAAMAVFHGYNETRRAEAEAELAKAGGRRNAPVTVTTHAEPAPPSVIVGPDGKPPPVAPQANGAGGPA